MGFLQDFGLDEIFSTVSEMAQEINGLKDDLLSGVKDDIAAGLGDPVNDLKATVQDISSDITGTGSDN